MSPDRRLKLALALCVFAAALCVYVPSLSNEFLDFDDEVYVTGNEMVRQGLTAQGFLWAFTNTRSANWQPLAWLSHQLDVQLFGLDPRGHHATSILLHAINSALVFLVCARMTGARGAAFAAALVFAVHPLHVESVSWVSSRKDLLSGVFWLLGLAAYLGYIKRLVWTRYALLLLLFVCACLSKPMAVTFPAVLLLLDFWPLARMQLAGGTTGRRELFALVVEKLPLFALVVIFSVITFVAQRSGGTMEEMASVGLLARVNNAAVAYARYISHTFWPLDLMFPYAHLGAARPLWHGEAAGALLATVTVIAWLLRRRAPSVLTGWLWFLGMLVPTIGLVQVGTQAMADRYMYLPLLGILFMVCWPVSFLRRFQAWRIRFVAALIAASAALGLVTWKQQAAWRDSESLILRAIRIEPDNVPARVQLAVSYLRRGRPEEAEQQLRAALAADPESAAAWSNLGSALRMQSKGEEAVTAFERALAIDPRKYPPALNLGSLLVELGRFDEAVPILERAVKHPSETGSGYVLLAVALARAGRLSDALEVSLEGQRLFPDDPALPGIVEELRQALSPTSV